MDIRRATILDTTLRDGSYAVNFSFTSSDTTLIARSLEEAGIPLIEIGHGVGLGGSRHHGQARQTDAEYLQAAAKALLRAKFGMFCIPGIATLDDLRMAIDQGMGFVRVGTDLDKINTSQPFIRLAKAHGLFVAANYMKAYAATPDEFAAHALHSREYGVDLLYIVDSAGSMLPEEVIRYIDAVRAKTDLALGFHGHDNLGMAIANSLSAITHGCTHVDASLQGLGRSAGNAATEVLVAACLRQRIATGVEFLKVLEAGDQFVRPLVTLRGKQMLDVVAGFAGFHSSYMHFIQKYSAEHQLHPAALMMELCKLDQVHCTDEIMEQAVRNVTLRDHVHLGRYDFQRYFGQEQNER